MAIPPMAKVSMTGRSFLDNLMSFLLKNANMVNKMRTARAELI